MEDRASKHHLIVDPQGSPWPPRCPAATERAQLGPRANAPVVERTFARLHQIPPPAQGPRAPPRADPRLHSLGLRVHLTALPWSFVKRALSPAIANVTTRAVDVREPNGSRFGSGTEVPRRGICAPGGWKLDVLKQSISRRTESGIKAIPNGHLVPSRRCRGPGSSYAHRCCYAIMCRLPDSSIARPC